MFPVVRVRDKGWQPASFSAAPVDLRTTQHLHSIHAVCLSLNITLVVVSTFVREQLSNRIHLLLAYCSRIV